jgi:signal transduction histidine kinase
MGPLHATAAPPRQRARAARPLLTPTPGGTGAVRPPPGRSTAWLVAVWAGLAAYAAWRLGAEWWGGERGLSADLWFFPSYPAAGLACALAARAASGRARAGLAALSAAWLASAAGEVLYLLGHALPRAAPWLRAVGDGLDVAYYPLATVAFLALAARPRGAAERLRVAANALLATAATATLAWYFVLRHLGPGAPWLANLESVLGSGAGEVAILFAAATALDRPADGADGPALHALAGGALSLALGDFTSAQHALAAAEGTSLAGDLFLVAGTALSATGGLLAAWPGGRDAIPRRVATVLRPLRRIPALAVAAVLAVLAQELLSGPRGAIGGLAAATAGFAVLVMARLRLAEQALEAEAASRAEREQRLRHAQKLEMLGLLTGGVAHDFANLLSSLGGLSASMRERHGDQAEELDELDGAVKRGRALCQRLLAMGRREPTQPRELDPRDVVEELLPFLRRLLPSGVEVLAAGARGAAPARVDRAQLELALMNLVVNARDAMPGGGAAWIRVEPVEVSALGSLARRGVPAGHYACVAVTDTGSGMDQETLRQACEPFFTTKPEGKGTGLGLATARAMAEAAGGLLLIDSAPGQGTAVTLLLPLAGPAPG